MVEKLFFTGREWDRESGLYFYRARYYDPSTGRFLQPDTLWNKRDISSLNRYAYVANNPVNYTDPTGREPFQYTYGQQPDFELEFLSGDEPRKVKVQVPLMIYDGEASEPTEVFDRTGKLREGYVVMHEGNSSGALWTVFRDDFEGDAIVLPIEAFDPSSLRSDNPRILPGTYDYFAQAFETEMQLRNRTVLDDATDSASGAFWYLVGITEGAQRAFLNFRSFDHSGNTGRYDFSGFPHGIS